MEATTSTAREEALWVVEPAEAGVAAALAPRLRALGFTVRPLRAASELAARLAGAAARPRVVWLSVALPDRSLEAALRVLAPELAADRIRAVAAGPERPAPARRRRLAEAGVALALFGELEERALRFQANRAFLGTRPRGTARRELRAPLAGAARVRTGGREKAARLYNVSPGGAFLETPRPSPAGAVLELELEAGELRFRLDAQVVHTNVPGNLQRPFLPVGMGVRFREPGPARAALESAVRTRSAELVL